MLNEKSQVFNSLQNIFAVSFLEGNKLIHKTRSESEDILLKLFTKIQTFLIGLFNNSFSISLYKNAVDIISLLSKVDNNGNIKEEYLETYNNLLDAITLIDAKNLRKYDPIDYLMNTVVFVAKKITNYSDFNKEELVKNRYDVMLEEMISQSEAAKLWIKINLLEANIISEIIKGIKKEYKDSPLIEVLIEAKNMILNCAILYLLSYDNEISEIKNMFQEKLLPIVCLFDSKEDIKDLIYKLIVFADLNYSYKHKMPISKYFNNDVMKYCYNNPLYIERFYQDNGYLLDYEGNILSNANLINKYFNDSKIWMDELLYNLLINLSSDKENIAKLKEVLEDKLTLINN